MKQTEQPPRQDHMTTGKALFTILRCNVIILRNAASAVNRLVSRRPWYVITAVALAAFTTAFVGISRARAERDNADKALYKLQQQVEQLKIEQQCTAASQTTAR